MCRWVRGLAGSSLGYMRACVALLVVPGTPAPAAAQKKGWEGVLEVAAQGVPGQAGVLEAQRLCRRDVWR